MNLFLQFAEGSWAYWHEVLLPFSRHSSVQESLRGTFRQEVGKLEQEVAALRRELASLKSDQEVMGKHVEGILEQLKRVRADVSAWSPACLAERQSRVPAPGLSSVRAVSGGSAVPGVDQSVPVTVPAGWCLCLHPPAGRLASRAPGSGAQDPCKSPGGPETVGTGCSGWDWSGPEARRGCRSDRGGECWPVPHFMCTGAGMCAWQRHWDSPHSWDIDPGLTGCKSILEIPSRAVPALCSGRGHRW